MLISIRNDDKNVDNMMVHIMNLQWTSDTPI